MEGLDKLEKKCNDHIWNRTSDLPALNTFKVIVLKRQESEVGGNS
jgi:hypothetical protein